MSSRGILACQVEPSCQRLSMYRCRRCKPNSVPHLLSSHLKELHSGDKQHGSQYAQPGSAPLSSCLCHMSCGLLCPMQPIGTFLLQWLTCDAQPVLVYEVWPSMARPSLRPSKLMAPAPPAAPVAPWPMRRHKLCMLMQWFSRPSSCLQPSAQAQAQQAHAAPQRPQLPANLAQAQARRAFAATQQPQQPLVTLAQALQALQAGHPGAAPPSGSVAQQSRTAASSARQHCTTAPASSAGKPSSSNSTSSSSSCRGRGAGAGAGGGS